MELRIIKTDEQHRRYLQEARRLMKVDPAPGSDDGARLQRLAKLIEDYERGRYRFGKPDPISDKHSIAMKEKLKRVRGSGNVFRDLGFDKAEAENLKMRSQLMMRIEDSYRHSGMTQGAAAKVLGITQPRLNALLKGNVGQFSIDALVNIANRAGLDVRLVIRKPALLQTRR